MQRIQETLSVEQLAEFYHDAFVEDQARDFLNLIGNAPAPAGVIVDVGGGCGFFARHLAELTGRRVRVLDMDAVSVETCRRSGIEAVQGDALQPTIAGDERVASFNLVLHHLVGRTEAATRELQTRALGVWREQVSQIFVNEYIYESFVGRLSGWLIFQITSSRVLSALGRMVAIIAPSLRANTFGVGVRFRAHHEWQELFESAGFTVRASVRGIDEHVAPPLRLLLIKHIRRDSYVLTPRIQ